VSDEVGTPHGVAADAARVAGDRLGRRNDRLLVGLLGGYIALLSVLMIVRGVSITPDVLLVALGLAAVLLGRGRLFFRDWIPFIGLFFAYELMRGYADNFGAAVHVEDVLAAERFLFLGRVPTEVLQAWLHPAIGTDWIAVLATVFYFLHFPLPIAVAFFLWLKRRRDYYDYVAALIVLSLAGFATYLVLPVAPPWWAADPHYGNLPLDLVYLKQQGFEALARLFGFEGSYVYSYTVYEINPNQVAAFPSLHAGYPFLGFLFARRAFGRVGWLMLVYSAVVWFSIVYLGDHYVVDILGGLAYAGVAYWAVMHGPRRVRAWVENFAETGTERRVEWGIVGQGAALFVAGVVAAVLVARTGFGGGVASPIYLVPWVAVLGGLWRAAAGLLSR
jgi:hypothetical protein